MSRICGGCTVCCKVYQILEIDKPAGQWCWHCQVGVGCLSYIHRPIGCRSFRCEWLKGWGGEGERPDRLGVVAEFFVSDRRNRLGILQLSEVELGKLEKYFGRLSEKEGSKKILTFIYADGRKEVRADPQSLPPEIRRSFEKNGFLFVPEACQEKA